MSKRFLVTGATGFIGGSLVRRLAAEGQEVHILTRQSSSRWRINDVLDRVVDHHADLRDGQLIHSIISQLRPDIIYHCGAYGLAPRQHDAIELAGSNLVGTVNLVEALMEVGYECLVNTGSSAEYGLKAQPMAEEDSLEPNNVYGATKAAATLYCQAVARSSQQPILTLRVFTPYGPYDMPSRLVPSVIRKCLAGEDLELSSGREARDFFFIDDLVDLYIRVPDTHWSPGEVVNVGSGTQHTVRDVAAKVMQFTGAQVQPHWGAFPPRTFDTEHWVADIAKVKSTFGWAPKIDFDEGLRRTIEWHRTFSVCRL